MASDTFLAPQGLPISIFAKLKSATLINTGTLEIQNKEIRVTDNSWTQFDFVYNKQSTAQDIFERDFQRLINLIRDGYSCSIITFGTHNSEKKLLLNGLITRVVSELLKVMNEGVKSASNDDAALDSFSITMQGIEIVEDTIFDLIDIKNKDLMLQDTAFGPSIVGGSIEKVTSSDTFQENLRQIYANRNQEMTEFGPKSAKSSFFCILRITQDLATDENDIVLTQLTFAELPSIDKINANYTELRMREGSKINKELIGIADLINSFQEVDRQPPYHDSITNSLLQDVIGGNCVSFVLVCLNSVDNDEINIAALEYAQKISQIENFPVINDSRMTGLLMRYHKKYFHVCQQLIALKQIQENMNDQHGGDVTVTNAQTQLLELKTKLLDKEKELLGLHGDRDKLREAYNNFRTKYSDLVGKKTNLQKELIMSEEKCLHLGKTLIDMQIENNEIKKRESSIRAELETKIISVENDVVETTYREQKLSNELQEMRNKMESLLNEKKQLSIEYVALRQNYMNLHNELDGTKEDIHELNIQLINLINANKELEQIKSTSKNQSDSLQTQNTVLGEENSKLKASVEVLEKDLFDKKSKYEQNKIELLSKDVEIKKLQTEIKSLTTRYEKNWIQLNHEKTKEIENITSANEYTITNNNKQLDEFQRENQALLAKIDVLTRNTQNITDERDELETKLRSSEQENLELKDHLNRNNATNDQNETQMAQVQSNYNQLKSNYDDEKRRNKELQKAVSKFKKSQSELIDEKQELQTQVKELQSQVKELTAQLENDEPKRRTASPPLDTSNDTKQKGNSADIEKIKAKAKQREKELQKQIQELKTKLAAAKSAPKSAPAAAPAPAGNAAGGGQWERVERLEKEKAELISRVNEAEMELKTIHTHYQNEIKKYKKMIAKLKKQG